MANNSSVYDLQEDSGIDDHISAFGEDISTSKNQTFSLKSISRRGANRDQPQRSETDPQEPTLKKRKCAVQKQTESLLRGPEHKADTKQMYKGGPPLQLSILAREKKQQEEKDLLFNVSAKIRPNSLFQHVFIPKFSNPDYIKSGQEPPTQSRIQHRQVTTTEQRLGLSKSTVEKLAAFKYKPKDIHQISATPNTFTDVKLMGTDLSSSYQVYPYHPHLSSYHGSSVCYHDPMHETIGNLAPNREPDLANDRFIDIAFNSDDDRLSKESQTNSLVNIEISNISLETDYCGVELEENHLDIVQNHTFDMANNTSSWPTVGVETCTNNPGEVTLSTHSSLIDNGIDSQGVRKRYLLSPTCQLVTSTQTSGPVDVQHQDSHGCDIDINKASTVLHLNNKFEINLGNDLLSPAQTQACRDLTIETSRNTGDGSVIQCITQPFAKTASNPQCRKSVVTLNTFADESGTDQYATSLTAPSDANDEYSIDEEHETELLKLARQTESTGLSIVAERFAPSASVQGAICIGSEESNVYDSTLQFSPPIFQARPRLSILAGYQHTDNCTSDSPRSIPDLEPPLGTDEADWSFVESCKPHLFRDPPKKLTHSSHSTPILLSNRAGVSINVGRHTAVNEKLSDPARPDAGDIHENDEFKPFVRPVFPNLILDRSPIIGLSARSFLRVCFRIGEMYKEGARCNVLGIDAVIELFARIGFSSREPGTIKQHFQFLDLWHDRPPIAAGILANYKTTPLAESESKIFLSGSGVKMGRCLGRLKRDVRNHTGWILHIINIRETDWEEIYWTRRIVSGDHSMSQKMGSDH
jgi:hypothetical protein